MPIAHQRHFAADVLAQQLVGIEQVVLVVLLEHADRRRLGQRSEMHRRRIDGGRDVHEAQVAGAARELQVAHVTHQRDVGVVDRERQLRLIVERRRQVLPGCDVRLPAASLGIGAGEQDARRAGRER